MSTSASESARRVAVVGLGLMGGSIARDLAARGAWVLGYDRDANALEGALAAGVVQEVLDGDSLRMPAEIVVLAVPVTSAAEVMARFAQLCREAQLITDVGSTKTAVQALAVSEGLARRFVGSHPLTGDHRSGWSASRVGRFDGARVFLCPAEGTSAEAVALAHRFWHSLGAQPEEITAADHDALLAWSSHLPQFVSCALAAALYEAGIPRAELGPGGRDATRLAGSSPDMWTAIANENGLALTVALSAVETRIGSIRSALAANDLESIRSYLEIAQQWFDGLPRGRPQRGSTNLPV